MTTLGFQSPPNYGPAPPADCARRTYDVCVIGSGAAGAVAAHELVRAGLSVVLLEQGPFIDERVSYSDIVKESERAYVRIFNGSWALSGFPWTSCNVGGGTVFYGAASFRLREVDFDASRFFPEADLPLAWPYPYAELAAYYEEIERHIGVAADPSRDPSAPPGSNVDYLPPIDPSPAGRVVRDGALALGLSPFATPLALNTIAYRARPACERLSPCIEYRCEQRAKGDVATVFLSPLVASDEDRFELYAGMRVARLERSSRDRVARAVAIRVDSRVPYVFSPRHFVVACSAIESAALLLRSADQFSPAGLGNDHDMVGRGLCYKASEWITGWHDSGEPENGAPLCTNDGPFSTVAVTDYYVDADAPGGLGGLIYEARTGTRYRFESGRTPVRIECLLADIPARENRVRLASDSNELGLPRTVMDYTPHPKDLARLEHMVARSEALLRAAGCRSVRRTNKDFRLGGCHLHGTCRGGDDPETSVVDRWSRVHDLENLFVIDGAFMPFPGGVNPTLTIQAHALRASRELARRAQR